VPRRFKAILTALALGSGMAAPTAAAPLRVGVEPDLHPIAFVGESGRLEGFVVELIDAVAAAGQLEVTFVVLPRVEMLAAFEARRIDALANVVRTPGREETMAFAVSHLELRNSLFVRRGAPLPRVLEDLHPLRVAVLPGTRSHD
jgi:ABC-type amino acid transport substrate-binding protein